jgi:DNA invertase Pin-like site-specific DNA recombinase
MANALVVHKDRLPQSQKILRAAQYVRMSTDYQRYSIENQAAVIAAYAQLHNLSIVHTYRDEGESGLKIKNRMGLTQLIEDVRSGLADFGHLLVFDVSRWGRFQDVDESAHYEFICKQAGIKVAYCAEQFDNDGSLISSIVKNIKRVMAAEFSRELSAKVYAGECRLARLGFKMGGPVNYGLQRLVVDEKSQPKGVLKAGERKFLITDRVRIRPGATDQVEVVKWIFDEFLGGKSQADIRRELNRRGVLTNRGRRWSANVVSAVLRNEAYIGNLVWNRVCQKLGAKRTNNPRDLWIRSEGCVEPIIDRDAFLRAKKVMEEYRVCISEDEMLARLRKVLMKKGSLSASIIDTTPSLPCCSTYLKHFGTLRNLYRLIGYNNTKYWEDLEAYQGWADLNLGHAALLREAFEKAGGRATFDPSIACLRVNDAVSICFGVAKWRKYEGRAVRWTLRRRVRWPAGWIVAIRLGNNNKSIQDYILLPSPSFTGAWLWISEEGRPAHKIESFESFEELARSLIKRVNKGTRGAPNKRRRSKASGSTKGRWS